MQEQLWAMVWGIGCDCLLGAIARTLALFGVRCKTELPAQLHEFGYSLWVAVS